MAEKRRARTPARSHALTLPRPTGRVARAGRWLPSTKSLAIGLTLVALAGGAYAIARETSVFAVQRIDVRGAPPALADQIETALRPIEGQSLVSFDRSAADHRLAGLPQIARVSYDRDFPHTLRVSVVVEEPVAIVRRASQAWLVASGGRVLQLLTGTYPALPRIWLAAETNVTVGERAETGSAILVATALRSAHLPGRVLSIRDEGNGQIVLQLQSGRQVRLGDSSNLAVKLAVAAAVLPRAIGASYVDVSVPSRVVAGYRSGGTTNSQVSGQG
ncbi:MAG TPA: FtsQ-type POTRA domain-containing protein [Gaiellaceae bacterium]|nr:FtsQ-type POTRA domain-containing protein [Gaiellaceae bacterium]